MTTLILQQDSVTLSTFHEPVDAWAEYFAGDFGDLYAEAARLYPKARRKAIAIQPDEDGDILDCENGDANPASYPGWHQRQRARGLALPGPYAAQDDMEEIVSLCKQAGITTDEMAGWEANPDGVPEMTGVLPGMKAKQYDWSGFGRNLDLSVCLPSFWADPAPTPTHPKNPLHYEWFAKGQRELVLEYDKLRKLQTPTKHPHRAEINAIRLELHAKAHEVYALAHIHKKPNGRPGWNINHRGWRFQQLSIRARGGRVKK